jgi:hypothetical protein
MPSASQFLHAIEDVRGGVDGTNNRLDQIEGKLDDLKASTDGVRQAIELLGSNLIASLGQLIALGTYADQALFQNALQNDTMICILEKISQHTCDMVNQAHLQTALQAAIEQSTTGIADLYALTHAEAALTREREQALRQQIEKCCPPKLPPPPCHYEKCPAPKPLGEPPSGGVVIE